MSARCLTLAILLVAAPASADRADTLKQQGIKAAEAKDWATARAKFEQAYALDHKPLTLYNLAAAQGHTSKLLAARASYTKFLIEGDDPRFHKLAQQALADLVQRIPTLGVHLTGAASDVKLDVDGATAEADVAVPLDPGPHTVHVTRDGKAVVTREVKLEEQARVEIEIAVPLPTTAVQDVQHDKPITQALPPGPPPPPQPEGRSIFRSPWFWGIAGAVVVGAGATYYAIARPESDPTSGTLGTIATH